MEKTTEICPNCKASLSIDDATAGSNITCSNCNIIFTVAASSSTESSKNTDSSSDVNFTIFGISCKPGWKTLIAIVIIEIIISFCAVLIMSSGHNNRSGNLVINFSLILGLMMLAVARLWFIALGIYTIFAKPPVITQWVDQMGNIIAETYERYRYDDDYFGKWYRRPMLFLLNKAFSWTSGMKDPSHRAGLRIIVGYIMMVIGGIFWGIVIEISIMLAIIIIAFYIWGNKDTTTRTRTEPKGLIRGTVTRNNIPVENARIYAFIPGIPGGKTEVDLTDKQGRFVLYWDSYSNIDKLFCNDNLVMRDVKNRSNVKITM